jgi:hypothetical protein
MVERGAPEGWHEQTGEAPAAEPKALETEFYLDGIDYGGIADKLRDLLPEDALEELAAGVDEDGRPMTFHELHSLIVGAAIENGLDPDEVIDAAGLMEELEQMLDED